MNPAATLTGQPPHPPHPATMTIPDTARLLGISRSAAYRAVARGEIPTIRIGRRLLVPTAKLYQLLGWTYNPAARPATTKETPLGSPPMRAVTGQA